MWSRQKINALIEYFFHNSFILAPLNIYFKFIPYLIKFSIHHQGLLPQEVSLSPIQDVIAYTASKRRQDEHLLLLKICLNLKINMFNINRNITNIYSHHVLVLSWVSSLEECLNFDHHYYYCHYYYYVQTILLLCVYVCVSVSKP